MYRTLKEVSEMEEIKQIPKHHYWEMVALLIVCVAIVVFLFFDESSLLKDVFQPFQQMLIDFYNHLFLNPTLPY